MNDEVLTADERRCLRMWFRQAIAQLEQEEVACAIKNELDEESTVKSTHRYSVTRRRTRRSRVIPHLREMVF